MATALSKSYILLMNLRICKNVNTIAPSVLITNTDHLTFSSTRKMSHRTRRAQGDEFLSESLPRLLSKIYKTYSDRDMKVLEFLQPEELRQKIDFSLPEDPVDNRVLESLAEQVIHYSVKTGHPYFFNQLFNGVDAFSLSGSIINEALNSSAYTYELGPVITLIEQEIIEKFSTEYIGYRKGEEDGIFCPGGSVANMYGMSLARHHKYPESKELGMIGLPPIHIYTSDMSHYSVKKGAFFMGFGLSNVVLVKSDKHGRMIPEALDAAIEESKKKGFTPLMVNGTSGTTVMGAYDPLNEIADVCERQGNIWLHVDACWGGAALLSPKLRHKMKGIERADSIAWDPHKMAGAILQCAVLITKHKDLLAEAHTAGARYLFQQDKVYDCSYDTGDKSVQCGRKIDAFKLWLLWKAYGSSGMAERIESCFDNALYLRQLLTETPGFRLLFEEQECTNTCFWYIPPSMRGQVEDADWWNKLSKVAPAIKGQMQVTGSMMIGYQPQGQFVNFFRMIVASPMTTREDMQHVISTIQRHGQNL